MNVAGGALSAPRAERADRRGRRTVLVLRPTVSGVDEKSAERLLREVRGHRDGDVTLAYLDAATPTLHDALDAAVADGLGAVLLLPVAVPRDRYLITWTQRAVANWRETRAGADLLVTFGEDTGAETAVAAAVASACDGAGSAVTASPASYRSPAWSEIEPHRDHVLVCKGPRCMAYGAGPVHRALTAAAKAAPQPALMVTASGCLSPCNLGPLVVVYPRGEWFAGLDPDDAETLVADLVCGTDELTGKRVRGGFDD